MQIDAEQLPQPHGNTPVTRVQRQIGSAWDVATPQFLGAPSQGWPHRELVGLLVPNQYCSVFRTAMHQCYDMLNTGKCAPIFYILDDHTGAHLSNQCAVGKNCAPIGLMMVNLKAGWWLSKLFTQNELAIPMLPRCSLSSNVSRRSFQLM
jgi:hypothetical protein